jgi:purine-cytosine permease-like protein
MAHNPVNHPARPIYRAIAALTGLYLVVFGVLGVIDSRGAGFFAQDDTTVLGQGTNLGHSVICIVLGAIIVVATVIGRNVDATVNKWFGYLFIVLGLATLATLRTDANYLNFSEATSIVNMVIGLVLLMAGMYGRVGTDEEYEAWQKARLVL